MTENSKLENMGSEFDNLSSSFHVGDSENEGVQKVSVSSDPINRVQPASTKSDSFVVDMEPFSHLIEKDVNANPRFTLQRNLSRKGSGRGLEKKFNPSISGERDAGGILTPSPRATATTTLHGGSSSMPEKPAAGPTDHSVVPQLHHQITITNAITAEGALGGRQSSFRRSQHSWALSPRRILLFFATLSSMGTILLIYFTLSMGSKMNGDGTPLDQ